MSKREKMKKTEMLKGERQDKEKMILNCELKKKEWEVKLINIGLTYMYIMCVRAHTHTHTHTYIYTLKRPPNS